MYLRTQMVPIVDGILRLRTFLQRPGDKMPRIYFDPKCSSTIDEFGKHKYRLQKDNRPIREEPIDRDNHGLKSIIYWLVVNFDFVDRSNRGKKSSHSYIDRPNQDDDQPWMFRRNTSNSDEWE